MSKVEEVENKTERKLDSIDNYNLMYMKKGASIEIKKSKSVADLTSMRLPRIHLQH